MPFESGAAAVDSAISGVGLFGYGLHLRSRIRSCQHWPQTTGRVIQSALETDDGYQIRVTYHYTVNGNDPENPAEAVVDRTSPGGLQYIISGMILLVMAVLVSLYPAHAATTLP